MGCNFLQLHFGFNMYEYARHSFLISLFKKNDIRRTEACVNENKLFTGSYAFLEVEVMRLMRHSSLNSGVAPTGLTRLSSLA